MPQAAVFLPVRLELRVAAAAPGDPPTLLRIRIFPDDLHLADHVEGFV